MELLNLSQAIVRNWEGKDWKALPVLLPQDTQPQPKTKTPNEEVLNKMLEMTLNQFVQQNKAIPTPEMVAGNVINDVVTNIPAVDATDPAAKEQALQVHQRLVNALTTGLPKKMTAVDLEIKLDKVKEEWKRKRELKVGTIVDKKWLVFQDPFKRGIITNGHVDYDKNEILLVADDWSFNSANKDKDPLPLMASAMRGNRDEIWKNCLNKNKPHVKRFINELKNKEQGKTCYIIGNGPSLQLNAKELKKIDKKNSIIMGVNRCPQLIPNIKLDYYVCIDFKAYPEWAEGVNFGKTKCCFVPTTNPEFINKVKTKEMYWFRHPYKGGVNELMEKKWKKMDSLDQGLCCTFSALHLAWYLGCDKIVFVGQDMSFTHGGRHIGEPLPWDMVKHDYEAGTCYLAEDINGAACITNKMFCDMRDHLVGACYFLKRNGIRIINASEYGILAGPDEIKHVGGGIEKIEIIEQRKLANIIKELN